MLASLTTSQLDLSSEDHKCLYKRQSIQNFLRYFSLDQSGGPTDTAIPEGDVINELLPAAKYSFQLQTKVNKPMNN